MSNKKIEEIEVLGSTKEEDYTKPIKVVSKREKENYEEALGINKKACSSKKRKLKKGVIQKIFCIISFLFILGCFVFYGSRLVKYYKIYNPKDDTNITKKLSDSIVKDSKVVTSGDGLYKVAGNYIYKGKDVNNYLKYSNLLWRILKIGNDGTVDLILENNINVLSFDKSSTDYLKSDINKYLNTIFIKNINRELLVKSSVCLDAVNDINHVTCEDTNVDNYVKLVDVNTFLNSKVDENTFISDDDTSNIWTSSSNKEKIWTINGVLLSEALSDEAYYVKPVVTLKNTNKLFSGKGTLTDPYVIDKKKEISIGDYVELGDDTYIAYEVGEKIVKLQNASMYDMELSAYSDSSAQFNLADTAGISYYLNNTYYNNLSYKDKLVKTKWYTGKYNGAYDTVYKDSVESYVGMLNVIDLKFGDDYGYYLLTPVSNTKVYIYERELKASAVNVTRNIKPTVAIYKNSIKSGKGTEKSPYKVGE